MNSQPQDPTHRFTLSRRSLLRGSASILAAGIVAALCPTLSLAAIDGDIRTKFMQLSNLLINHELSPAVGGRIVETAERQYKNLPDMLDAIIKVAQSRNAIVVEDFFADIPDGELKDFAHWVIASWYSGCSSDKRDAIVFTYEEALTFKTTSDVITIPSYGISGPNLWTRPTVPLSAPMPRF